MYRRPMPVTWPAPRRVWLRRSNGSGRLDILVNNAATNPYYGPTLGVDEGRFDKTFQVNLKGPLYWAREAYEHSMKENPGVIINIASVGGLRTEGAASASTT